MCQQRTRDAWQYRLLTRMNALRRERHLATASAAVRFGSQDRLVFQRGASGKHSAWIFTNNLPNCSGRIQYPVAPPDPPQGMYWRDALFNEPFEILDGSTMAASTKPLVLVLEPSYAVSWKVLTQRFHHKDFECGIFRGNKLEPQDCFECLVQPSKQTESHHSANGTCWKLLDFQCSSKATF